MSSRFASLQTVLKVEVDSSTHPWQQQLWSWFVMSHCSANSNNKPNLSYLKHISRLGFVHAACPSGFLSFSVAVDSTSCFASTIRFYAWFCSGLLPWSHLPLCFTCILPAPDCIDSIVFPWIFACLAPGFCFLLIWVRFFFSLPQNCKSVDHPTMKQVYNSSTLDWYHKSCSSPLGGRLCSAIWQFQIWFVSLSTFEVYWFGLNRYTIAAGLLKASSDTFSKVQQLKRHRDSLNCCVPQSLTAVTHGNKHSQVLPKH